MNLIEPTAKESKTEINFHDLSYEKVTIDLEFIETMILHYRIDYDDQQFVDFIQDSYSAVKIGPKKSKKTTFIFQYLQQQCGIKYVHGLNSFVLLLTYIKNKGGDVQKAFNNFIDILENLTDDYVGSNMLMFTHAGSMSKDMQKLLQSHKDFVLVSQGRNKNSNNMIRTYMYTNEYK